MPFNSNFQDVLISINLSSTSPSFLCNQIIILTFNSENPRT